MKIEDIFSEIKNYKENEITSKLIHDLSCAKRNGYITKDEFLKIGMWKSSRQKQTYLKNKEEEIKEITSISFNCKNEKVKIISLTALEGVSIPTASAILTLVDPENYGVIDIRVWQVLYSFGLVSSCESGVGLTLNDWIKYLQIIREYAKNYQVSTRTIEQILFRYHKNDIQEGNLYKQ
jgi:hypothetical protein